MLLERLRIGKHNGSDEAAQTHSNVRAIVARIHMISK